MAETPEAMLKRIRKIGLALPKVTERLSHGEPTFFINDRATFMSVMVRGHHNDNFPYFVCAASHGVQSALVAERPDSFFVPAYVGGRGWIGVRLDRGVGWDEIATLCEEAYRTVAPRPLIVALDDLRTGR